MPRFAVIVLLAAAVISVAAGADPIEDGRLSFEQKCAGCHTIAGGDRVGPDLQGVTGRRSGEWLLSFVTDPARLIAANDPVAVRLVEQYNRIVMPTLGLPEAEARSLLAYIADAGAASAPAAATPQPAASLPVAELLPPQATVLDAFLLIAALITAVFAGVAISTRWPAEVDVKRAYGVRKVFFGTAVVALVVVLAVTLPRSPYARADARPDRVVYVAARQFEFVFSDEPIQQEDDLGRVPRIGRLELAPDTLVEFRVTSLDVNHGFGLYGPGRQLLAQTQAMPGYVNRLLVRIPGPGAYEIFCLEYCAAGHHRMQSAMVVR